MKATLFVSFATVFNIGMCNKLCSSGPNVDITEGLLTSNGSVFHNDIEYTSDAWYEDKDNGETVKYGCPCIVKTCVWKCCGQKEIFVNYSCMEVVLPEVDPFSPTVYKGRDPTDLAPSNLYIYYDRQCNETYILDPANNEKLFPQENGTLIEVASGGTQWHAPHTFCLEWNTANLAQTPRIMAGVCYPDELSKHDDSPILYTLYAIGMFLSVPFLLATFLVYALIPELRNLHGMCLMAYCAGLIVSYLFLAYLKLQTGRIDEVTMSGCLGIAFIIYYSFQTSFFWLNVMCFDIWRTFSGYRGGSTSKRRERKRFAMYAVYAWGVPLLLTAVTAGMQFGEPAGVITPKFGTNRCWFSNWIRELVYFYSPVLVLVVCNITFFSVTAYRIRSIRQETAILKGAESSRSDKLQKDKQRYVLYLKLFIVMGINWTIELISFAVGGSNWYYIVIDISVIGLGVFIFFIFVWKKKVRMLVQRKYRSMRGDTSSEGHRTRWATSTAPTEDTRVSSDDTALRLKDLH